MLVRYWDDETVALDIEPAAAMAMVNSVLDSPDVVGVVVVDETGHRLLEDGNTAGLEPGAIAPREEG